MRKRFALLALAIGTAPAPLTSAELTFFGSVISRVSGDVAATDTTADAAGRFVGL
jgi:hypothetical protein